MSFDVALKIGNINNDEDVHKHALDLTPIDWHESGVIDPVRDSKTMEKFGIITLPDSAKPFIIEAVKERNNHADDSLQDTTYRQRSKYLDINYLLSRIDGGSSLYNNWRAKDYYVPKVDLRHVSEVDSLFKDISNLDISKFRKDLNSVSSGSYTVGSGGDYATFSLAAADTANLTGDITFTQISDVTETAVSTWSNFILNYTCTITSNSDPQGSPNNGWTFNHNHTSDGLSLNFNSGSGTVIVEKLHFKSIDAAVSLKWFLRANNSGHTLDWKNLLFDVQGNNMYSFFSSTSTASSKFSNFIIWGSNTIIGSLFVNKNGWLIENGFIYDCNIGLEGNFKTGTIQNVYVADSTTTDGKELTSLTGNNNASSDTTLGNANWGGGSNNLTSLTTSNEIQSLDDTNENFAKPIHNTSNIYDGGIVPTGETNDIAGTAWDLSNPSIGAFQSVAAGPAFASMLVNGMLAKKSLANGRLIQC